MTVPVRLKLDLNERADGLPTWAEDLFVKMPKEAIWKYVDRLVLEASLAKAFGLNPEQVLATNGGDEAIAYLFSNLAPDSEVLLPLPIFGFYREQATFWPVRPVEIPARADFGLDWVALNAAIKARNGGLLVLTRPNNPTGETPPKAMIVALINRCAARGIRVLLDEAYAEFAEDDLSGELRNLPNLILLRTFSKAYGLAGLRMGYLLGAPELLAPLRKNALPYNLASTSIFAGLRALESDAQAEVRDYAAKVSASRVRIEALLADAGMRVYSGQANFVFFSTNPLRAAWIFAALAAQGIAIRRFDSAELAACLRITIPADTSELEVALLRALKPELLCLDVDGTLMDTSGSFDAVIFELVTDFGGVPATREELLAKRRVSGYNDDYQLARALLLERGIEVDLARIVARADQLYFGDPTRPGLNQSEKPLISRQALARIAQRVPLALVTGRTRRELEPKLPVLGLQGVFAATIDRVSAGKPSPEGIFAAMAQEGAQRVWMVGDNLDDILAARAAGALGIAVGPNSQALLQAGAVLALNKITDLEALL